MELNGSELAPEGSWEIPALDGREILLDGNNGRVEPIESIEAHSKEKCHEERIWEILNAHRLKRYLDHNINILKSPFPTLCSKGRPLWSKIPKQFAGTLVATGPPYLVFANLTITVFLLLIIIIIIIVINRTITTGMIKFRSAWPSLSKGNRGMKEESGSDSDKSDSAESADPEVKLCVMYMRICETHDESDR